MKILLIAPHFPELNTPLELEQLGAGHQVVALTGNVTHERLTRASTGGRFDAIHVASHCAKNEIALSGGEVLTWDQLGQIGRKVRADLVFLNACESAFVAQALIDSGLPVVVAWTIPVLDENGVRTASFFYDELHHNQGDLHAAYRKVNPQDGTFLFLAGEAYVESILQPLINRLDQLTQQIASMMTVLMRQRTALVIVAALLLVALFAAAALLFTPWSAVSNAQVNTSDQPANPLRLTPTAEPPTPTFIATAPTDSPAIPTDTPVILPPTPTATLLLATDTPVILPPTDTPKPRRTATDTPSPYPTWTKTPQQPLTATLLPATALPGCRASNVQPKKCDPTPVTNQPPAANNPATLTPGSATAQAALAATATAAARLTLSTPVNPLTPTTPLPYSTYDQAIFTPWPTLSPSVTPTPLGEPPDPPALTPCFTSVQNQ